tara:strand:+ start:644 stop:763 length:120 start_codon:yes stop_codon:yes gene_type:complete
MQLEREAIFEEIITPESTVGEGLIPILISNKKVAAAFEK